MGHLGSRYIIYDMSTQNRRYMTLLNDFKAKSVMFVKLSQWGAKEKNQGPKQTI